MANFTDLMGDESVERQRDGTFKLTICLNGGWDIYKTVIVDEVELDQILESDDRRQSLKELGLIK